MFVKLQLILLVTVLAHNFCTSNLHHKLGNKSNLIQNSVSISAEEGNDKTNATISEEEHLHTQNKYDEITTNDVTETFKLISDSPLLLPRYNKSTADDEDSDEADEFTDAKVMRGKPVAKAVKKQQKTVKTQLKKEEIKIETRKSKGIISRLKDKVSGKKHNNEVPTERLPNLSDPDYHYKPVLSKIAGEQKTKRHLKMGPDYFRDRRNIECDDDMMNNFLINVLSLNHNGRIPLPLVVVKTKKYTDPVLMLKT